MKTTKTSVRWLWLIVAAQAVFLLAWAGYHEVVRHTAVTVRLKGAPVDPRDIVRGDYMTLNYEISRHVAPAGWAGDPAEVYVVLKPKDGLQVIDTILLDEPDAGDPRLWVVAQAYGNAASRDSQVPLHLSYGIETFYVPEGQGTPGFKSMEVEASVSPTHHLYLKHVFLDGKSFP